MKPQTLIAEQGSLQFTRKNLGFPVPRRMSDQDVNEETQETNAQAENAEGIRDEDKDLEGPDENERINDGFESQEDRY